MFSMLINAVMDMTKREQYKLTYNKVKNSNGKAIPIVNGTSSAEDTNVLVFIGKLDISDVTSFIYDLNLCINHGYDISDGFFSDPIENVDITYNYPNVKIDGWYTISMQDMLALLQEWQTFITA